MHKMFIFLMLLLPFAAIASPPFEFGTVTHEEINLEYYRNKYPGEPAVVIGDIGSGRFVYDNDRRHFKLQFERVKRFLILEEEGLEWGNYSIYYHESDGGRDDIRTFRAHVYNDERGRIRRQRVRKRAGVINNLSNNTKELAFALPNVRVGSIIEVQYRIESDFLFGLRPWVFQDVIPVEYSKYSLTLLDFYNYTARFSGTFELDQISQRPITERINIYMVDRESGPGYGGRTSSSGGSSATLHIKGTEFTWIATNIEPLKLEPFTDNIINYLGKMFFELRSVAFPNEPEKGYTRSWIEVNEFFLTNRYFGEYLTNALVSTRDLVPQDTDTDPMKSAHAALEIISDIVKWNGDASRYTDNNPNTVIRRGSGNSTEINLLLVALLRNMDVEAYPVLLSTVDNGRLFSEDPTISQWDYTIAKVKIDFDNYILLDATPKKPMAGYLPIRTINGKGRVIDRELMKWVDLEENAEFHSNQIYDVALDEKGNLSGTLTYEYKDYAAFLLLQRLEDIDDDVFVKDFAEENGARMSNIKTEYFTKDELLIRITADFFIEGYAQLVDNEIIVPSLFTSTLKENPFTSLERKYPIVFPFLNHSHTVINVELPDKISINFLPTSKKHNLGPLEYDFSFNETDSGLMINAIVKNGVRSLSANNYPALRQYMDRMVSDNLEAIIFRID